MKHHTLLIYTDLSVILALAVSGMTSYQRNTLVQREKKLEEKGNYEWYKYKGQHYSDIVLNKLSSPGKIT